MIEDAGLWLVLLGFATGVAVTAVLLWRLPRREDDVGAAEHAVEARWIASIIERQGGVAPASFVEEVLDLHQAYLRASRVPGPPAGTAPPPVPPAAPPVMAQPVAAPPLAPPPGGPAPGYGGRQPGPGAPPPVPGAPPPGSPPPPAGRPPA
jgi:hypothetical protein